jgi:hypothetical protein
MGQGHMAFLVIDFDGLAVIAVCSTGGTVAGMPDGHGSLWQRIQDTAAEYLTDETDVFMGNKHTVIVNHDAAAFLAPMLQRIESEVYKTGHIFRLFCHNAEDTAFFVDTHANNPSFLQTNKQGSQSSSLAYVKCTTCAAQCQVSMETQDRIIIF